MNNIDLTAALDDAIPTPPTALRHAPLTSIRRRIGAHRRNSALAGLAACAVVIASVAAGVAVWPTGRRSEPGTGPHTEVTIHVSGLAAGAATLDQVVDGIQARATALGLTKVRVRPTNSESIVVSVGARVTEADLAALVTHPEFQVRKVINSYQMRQPEPDPSPSPHVTPSGPATLTAVQAKLGDAYLVAQGIQSPGDVTEATLARLSPFAALTGAEVAVLPLPMQFAVPTVSCAQLAARPKKPTSTDPDGRRFFARLHVVTCFRDGWTKYLLGSQYLTSQDVDNTTVVADPAGTDNWFVSVNLTPSGRDSFASLSREATLDEGHECVELHEGHCAIAFLLDDQVLSAPAIMTQLSGDGGVPLVGFSKPEARAYAALIQLAALPVSLTITSVSTNIPTR